MDDDHRAGLRPMDLTRTVADTRRLVLAAALVFATVAVGSGVAPLFGESGDRLGIRRFVTPAITPDWSVSEVFRMDTKGLRAITVHPARVGVAAGRVRFELRTVTPHAVQEFRSGEVAAAEIAGMDAYRFEFSPIADSRGVVYRLDVLSSHAAPSGGVALLATRGERLPDAVLLINGVERWAELAFETDATHGALATAKAAASLATLGIAWIAFVLLLREIIRLS